LSVALIAGAFILILGITGAIMAFEPEVDRLLHHRLSYVKPQGSAMSLSEIGESVSREFGGEPVVAYFPSQSPNLASEVILPRGIVCVNQYTGEILGVRTRGQTFLGFAHDLHVRLASGEAGRYIMRWSGVAALISLFSGLYLWWPRKRLQVRGNWSTLAFWFGLHNCLGIVLLLPLFVLAATGTIIGFEDQAAAVLSKFTGPAQLLANQSDLLRPRARDVRVISPDEAVRIARAQIPGASPYLVQLPEYGGAYRINLDYPQDRIAGRNNFIVLDPYGGRVISVTRSTDLSHLQRIVAANQAIHRGLVFGMPTRIVACLTSLMVPIQVISGLLLWRRGKSVLAIRLETR
jgi:uncharacterized iron-regulated membrane protein